MSAYITGEVRYEERTDRTFDYSWRTDVVSTGIMCVHPITGEDLWNAADWHETRKDAMTARTATVAIPRGASELDAVLMTKRISVLLAVRYGAAIEFALHRSEGDESLYHAHFLFSRRQFDGRTFGETIKRLDSIRSTGKAEIKWMRVAIAGIINRQLEHRRVAIRVSAASYADRGMLQIPTITLGRYATTLERNGIRTRLGDHNRTVEFENRVRRFCGRSADDEIERYKSGDPFPLFSAVGCAAGERANRLGDIDGPPTSSVALQLKHEIAALREILEQLRVIGGVIMRKDREAKRKMRLRRNLGGLDR